MAQVRTVDFLPEIFQTSTNKQFLGATLDQLVQEPDFGTTQGYIGRRIGPGVNANDKYVIEPTRVRSDYQLEPGVVLKTIGEGTAEDAITYPGMLDTLALQGAPTNNAQRLFASDYYAWDPMIDFDKFVNFAEYYWVPGGPDPVDVFGSPIPIQADIQVTRNRGYYSFDLATGRDPTITLIRGGSYKFNVTQNLTQTVSFRVTNRGAAAYVIDYQQNPNLTLVRGNTYEFVLSIGGVFPFWIKTQQTTGLTNQYNTGVTNNGAVEGVVVFTVPYDAPDRLYYISETSENMKGQLNIVNPESGTGPGFFIQAEPGVDGVFANATNISSRDVLGVGNNGEDLGTVSFDVPLKTAQNFYYTLPEIPAVDLANDNLRFDQINLAYVDEFLATYGGIDGITDLQNRTLIFTQNPPIRDEVDAEYYGWVRALGYSPNVQDEVIEPGDYDNPSFSQVTPIIPLDQRFVVWTINYNTDLYGRVYMTLTATRSVAVYEKFKIKSGNVYATTQWYKNIDGVFERIPLLTAVLDTLYYQDSADPTMFGEIRLIDQDEAATIYIEDIIGKANYTSPNGVVFTNGLKVQFLGDVIPTTYKNKFWYVEGVGTAIRLLDTANFINPENYAGSFNVPFDSVPYDSTNYDVEDNQPLLPDYLTINRASLDLNAWTRYNCWFHRNVLTATGTYNNQPVLLDQEYRAKRPILEYRAGLRLIQFGTKGKPAVDIIDFTTLDAFSEVNGKPQYIIDGYALLDGSRVIFAADTNATVRSRTYRVDFIIPDSQPPLITQPVINLVEVDDTEPAIDDTVVVISGLTVSGKSFYYDGVAWLPGQAKTGLNQPPLFDVYDADGISLANTVRYPSSNFAGTKIFSYAQGTGAPDPVLGFPIKYLTISNVGDIVFDNNFYTDTFLYVVNRASTEELVSQGFIRQYSNQFDYADLTGWQRAIEKSKQYQQFRFTYDGSPLQLDVRVLDPVVTANEPTPLPTVKIYVANNFVQPSKYNYVTTDNTTVIRLTDTYVIGDVIEVLVLSDQVSSVAFYQIPSNLEYNPFNINSPEFTLGTVRAHYETIGENLITLTGPINGANNSRDLGDIIPYGTNIVQQSAALTLPGFFMRSQGYGVFDAITYNSQEYVKFKNKLMDAVANNSYNTENIGEILTQAMTQVTIGQDQTSPFYWSDMLPAGAIFTQRTYTYTAISTPVFDLTQVFDFTRSNYQALNVTVNGVILTRTYDYDTVPDAPSVVITSPLSVGDVIVIQEFSSTIGNFVPNTPTKMGLYPAYRPQIYEDTSYINPTNIILGHDGSKTVAFGDIRDLVLLEFETRIFNNLKIHSAIPIQAADVVPGQFRPTEYTGQEVQAILDQDFLGWVGWNKLEYTTQDFNPTNPWTWNYRESGNKLTGRPLLGAWRGIYLYLYDTVTPNTTPWEMLGFAQRPAWWVARYGAGPYTSGNLVLWDDLEAGRIADPEDDHIDPRYARPGLTQIIPAGPEGELLPPIDCCVGAYDPTGFRLNWNTFDYGPVEYSWRASSAYPFAVMRLMALLKPAEFFSLFADRDRYVFNDTYQQYLYDDRYRLDTNTIQVYGLGVSKASYINWIVDYNAYTGNLSAAETLTLGLANLDVRLCYRMAGFSNKQYLNLFLEKPSPNSVNTSLLLPDDSYDILLYKNQPFNDINYSSIVVQSTDTGWAVFGYGITKPYFSILQSRPTGMLKTITAGDTSVKVPAQYTTDVVNVPYGFVFDNPTVVCDFILSYGKLLESQGMTFTSVENGYIINWDQMASEFLYWANQGWAPGSIINLNPTAVEFTITKPLAIVDDLVQLDTDNQPQDQNHNVLPINSLIIQRLDNTFTMASQDQQTISFAHLRFINYEHVLVLRNTSLFGDLVYSPATGARQYRLRLVGSKSNNWNGQLNAPGFILNEDNVRDWVPNRRYTKGQIVRYKNFLYSALTIVQPKTAFDPNDWVSTEYDQVQTGLLPNLANKANQLINSYDINRANLDRDNDLLSYGLTGFRPRQYMASLDLNDVSQVNVYRQFIGDKGTIGAVRLLTNANLGKEAAEYEIYENWAILSGIYGAQDNRRYIDFRLNEEYLTSNNSIVQLINPGEPSEADQAIITPDVWSSSYPIVTPNFLPTRVSTVLAQSLPSAGYVDIDDVDVTIFNLDDPAVLNPYFDSLGVGSRVWVAAVNQYTWDIYRCSDVPGNITEVSDNIDGTWLVTNNSQHGLSAGEIVIIKQFDPAIDGTYRIVSVPSLYTFIIELVVVGTSQTTFTGDGLMLKLQTMRVRQPADAVDLPYAYDLRPGAEIWVDNNGTGQWEVLIKDEPLIEYSEIDPIEPEPNTKFGSAVTQRADNLVALVGRPDFPGDRGTITNFLLQSTAKTYLSGQTISLRGAQAVGNYGAAVDLGANTWGAAGAPLSLNYTGYASVLLWNQAQVAFEESQILLALDQPGPAEFGYSVAVSNDERWLYVGAPAANAVYAYGRQDVETESISYRAPGAQGVFSTTGLQFDYDTQLIVALNGETQILGQEWYLLANQAVAFYQPPAAGSTVVISRRESVQLDTEYYKNITPTETTGLGENSVFNIDVVRGNYVATIVQKGNSYSIGEVLTVPGTVFGGSTPLNDCDLTVTSVNFTGGIEAVVTSGSLIPPGGLPTQFPIQQYLWGVADIDSITVLIDGQLQRPKIDYEVINADSTLPDSTGSDVLLEFVQSPGQGAVIRVFGGTHFIFAGKITVAGLPLTARFGESVACGSDGRQVMIGAPGDYVNNIEKAGSVYVFSRHVERFQVTDPAVTTYTTNATLVSPTAVKLNNVFLNNSLFYANGQYTPGVSSATILTGLEIGDDIEIETNQFQFMQRVTSGTSNIQLRSNFGTSVDLCRYNCSLYVGQPNYSGNYVRNGQVDRQVSQARVYGRIKSLNASPSLTPGNTIRVNNFEVAVPASPNNTLTKLAQAISQVPNVVATVDLDEDGAEQYITIVVRNPLAADPGYKLEVLPGAIGTLFSDLGFAVFAYTQTMTSPYPVDEAKFGSSVNINSSATTLTVGAPGGTTVLPVVFDNGTTTFDFRSTQFRFPIAQSGAVYTFDYLNAVNGSLSNPDQFIFGQQVYNLNLESGDMFGAAVDYTGALMLLGAPGIDIADSTGNEGGVYIFSNDRQLPAWQVKQQEVARVNVDLINSVSMYDRLISTTNVFLDFFDPLQGKILGVCERNIDYTGANDPASYNVAPANITGNTWYSEHVGMVWWDTARVRFIDPLAGDLQYENKRWGQIFPGSEIDVYQWVEWPEPPASYTGPGVPYAIDRYSVITRVGTSGVIESVYYFWVRGIQTVSTQKGKTLSVDTVAQYIANPSGSGIAYLVPLNSSTVGLVNSRDYISAADTILHIEWDLKSNDSLVHTEYDLIADGKEDSLLPPDLFNKLKDSLCGIDVYGKEVPDPRLSPAMRYGVLNRPRQSMFVDRFAALHNFVNYSNRVMALYPLAELNVTFSLLNSSEPEPSPTSGEYNLRVANLEQLGWQDIYIVPEGYRYLVASDSDNAGLWTIYQVMVNPDMTRYLLLMVVQSYDTKEYWSYVNWYLSGYDPAIPARFEVANYAALATITDPYPGLTARVLANAQNKWEIYRYTDTAQWERVALQQGTIEIDASVWNYTIGRVGYDDEVFDARYYDDSPVIETRKIVEAIFTEVFIGELAIYANQLTILLFNYILSEEQAPSWLMKTSLIDVTHKIRQLLPYTTYRRDNQDFILQYLQEVKPYHVQVRQFDLQYSGLDVFGGDFTDFDLPARYDTSLVPPSYQSPILDPDNEVNSPASTPPDAEIWSLFPYSQWYQNFTLELTTVDVIMNGSGYTQIPTVTVTGRAKRLPTLTATVNSLGQVIAIDIVDAGENYLETPVITISGGNGTGATAVPRMVNDLVRVLNTTIKFDRYQYQQDFVEWEPNVSYDNGTLVRYADRIWSADSTDSTAVNTVEFDPTDWILLSAGELSGVDRTMGYYIAGPGEPGRVLPLLVDGVDYPGVQVRGVPFNASTGYDRDPYDNEVYDNYEISPEGTPTYSNSILDSILESQYLDSLLGTRPSDIITDGGAYVDTYESHAPEELVPGITYDTLDFRVYTRPGADWTGTGHGFAIESVRFSYDSAEPTFAFGSLISTPVTVQVTNITQQIDLNLGIDYTVDWPSLTVTVLNANQDDTMMIRVFQLGGGNQLYRVDYLGNEVGNRVIIPVAYSEIQEFAVFVNGVVTTNYTYSDLGLARTLLQFPVTYTAADFLNITALGVTPITPNMQGPTVHTWSDPQAQIITITNPTVLTYPLTNSLSGSNRDMMIVTQNGRRVRPAETIEHYADGSIEYLLPTRGGYSQGLIADNDVRVYLDDVLQEQGTQYTVVPWDGSTLRSIEFVGFTPDTGQRIVIAVSTRAQYTIDGSNLTFRVGGGFGGFALNAGDEISVTTWNDTSEQNLLTLVFVGPVARGAEIYEGFDDVPYSIGTVLNGPGSYDWSEGTVVYDNDLNLTRVPPVSPERIWVDYNGNRLVNGIGFTLETIDDEVYVVLPFTMNPFDIVTVTLCTEVPTPDAMAFRIFQDMRGGQAVFRMTPENTTTLAQSLSADADIVYVTDVSVLGDADPANNQWGVLTVNGERIMYRYRDLVQNTVSGLLRGTAGTAAYDHRAGSTVYDMSSGNMLPIQYENYLVYQNFISDGKQNTFVATDINLDFSEDSTLNTESLRVSVGGRTLLATEYVIVNEDPVTIQLYIVPPAGVEITMAVLRGTSFYSPLEPGVPLQLQTTPQAKFLRGE